MPDTSRLALRKVCGITRRDDAAHAVHSGAEAIGMIFYRRSPRAVTVSQAEKVAAAAGDARRVGVFVNESPDVIAETANRVPLQVVQLHGDEGPADCDAVRNALPNVTIWKAVRIGPEFDLAILGDFAVDAFLLDKARAGVFGGTGETFDWQLALAAKRHGRIVLSGGLDGANVAEAIRVVRPWGVDASSRLETRPGVKDPAKVTAFLEAASCLQPN